MTAEPETQNSTETTCADCRVRYVLLAALESIEKQTGERWVRTTARDAIAQARGQS